ncbi:DUF5712 family protein [Flavobacterium sp. LHD-85]|uniref:DUF5712 family protein n=1 Tax=Flavobacterium sp. LHD-85 TaxID=3071410 RepID=UPI0027DEAE11|nr:DUF5712 family protein [Flavobacterium sp. LHD-85]MDQ6532014.1 DUF5712 family protein [Flavobacterium sp. LHD-85]
MYISITDSETGSNKAGSEQLVNYLEKENRAVREDAANARELWFNTASKEIIPQEVRIRIDNNIAKLGRNDAKFFLINISPSQKEIGFLKERFGVQGAEEKLKQYAVRVMDAYADNFKRPSVHDSKDLLWYGKLERNRYYSFKDDEVIQGTVKAGDRKPGEQLHVQIIVSRKDISNKIKLSPLNNSRGLNKEHSEKLGQFDRVAFKGSAEQIFDQMFGFDRPLEETVNYALTMKKGCTDQKQDIYLKNQLQSRPIDSQQNSLYDTVKVISPHNKPELQQLIDGIDFPAAGLFDILSADNGLVYENMEDQIKDFRKKKKKKRRPPGI